VMAVVSDKVTEVKANPSSSLPGLAQKRAGLNAAYDYYPFGMLMPGRSVEDNSVQCIPITRSRLVNQVNTGNVLLPAVDDHLEPPVIIEIDPSVLIAGDQVFNAKSASVIQLGDGGGGLPIEVISAQYGGETEVAGYITLPAITSGQTGLSVTITNPSMNADGMMFFTLSKLNDPSDPTAGEQDLTQVEVETAGESAVLEVDYGLNEGDVLRLWAHGVANTPYMEGYLKVTVPSVVTSVITQTVQTYVAMSCDTDGAFHDGYRFGFNGQQKDNEVAGLGNHNTAQFWEMDPRIGRRWNSDPIITFGVSQYSVNNNNPIFYKDNLGNSGEASITTDDHGHKTMIISATYHYIEGEIDANILNSIKDQFGKYKNITYNGETMTVQFNITFIPEKKGTDLSIYDGTNGQNSLRAKEISDHNISEESNAKEVTFSLDNIKLPVVAEDDKGIKYSKSLSGNELNKRLASSIAHGIGHNLGMIHNEGGVMKDQLAHLQLGHEPFDQEKIIVTVTAVQNNVTKNNVQSLVDRIDQMTAYGYKYWDGKMENESQTSTKQRSLADKAEGIVTMKTQEKTSK